MKEKLTPEEKQKLEKADALARQVLEFARNTLFIQLQFMKNILGRCEFVPYNGTVGTDGVYIYYYPFYLLKQFEEDQKRATRIYLHMILHCVFQHQFVSPTIRRDVWNLACDIAVEKMIQDLHIENIDHSLEPQQESILTELGKQLNYMTAEKIYHFFMQNNISEENCQQLQELFSEDQHDVWYGEAQVLGELTSCQAYLDKKEKEEREELQKMWKKLAKQLEVDLETFSKNIGTESGSLMQNLRAVNRERCNYENFLKKFSVHGEVMKLDTDSFDYQFYCYGRMLYEEAVLIEPLEYKDVKRIKEFVIAIDTSGSVAGETVQKFMQKTYNILKQQESFFSKVNIHIIQCDTEIQEDVKITNQEEFDEYLNTMTLKGFGGTDFRPVFSYVNELIEQKEFTNLKGLLYFTDGYGTFPEHQPDYQTAFVFLDDEYNSYEVPVWAIKVILTTDDIIEDKGLN